MFPHFAAILGTGDPATPSGASSEDIVRFFREWSLANQDASIYPRDSRLANALIELAQAKLLKEGLSFESLSSNALFCLVREDGEILEAVINPRMYRLLEVSQQRDIIAQNDPSFCSLTERLKITPTPR